MNDASTAKDEAVSHVTVAAMTCAAIGATETRLIGPAGRLAVYLINMDRAENRRMKMEARLTDAGLAYERVPAIDGQTLTFPIPEFSERSYRLLHGRRWLPAEVGCYLSHVECAKRLLETQAEYALILEDDVAFGDTMVDAINAAIPHQDCWDILRLTTVNSGRRFPIRNLGNGHWLAMCLTREKGAGAYIINRKAAEWIAHRLLPIRVAYDIAFDLEYLHGLKAAFIHPLVASQLTRESTQIQTRQHKLPAWRYITVLPYRSYLEVTRVLIRGWTLCRHRLTRRARTPATDTACEPALAQPVPGSAEHAPLP
jgi:glycosyl transferase, family 25